MSEAMLMENTKNTTFSRFNEKVFNRNRRFFRKIEEKELTSAMCASAGIAVPESVRAKEAKVVKAETPKVIAQVKEAGPEKAQVDEPKGDGRPDTTGWNEDQLRDYAQDKDIPTHPAAKIAGLNAAITRHFDELKLQED